MSEQTLAGVLAALDSILAEPTSVPPHWRRWIAMHYPDARVRRDFWISTNVRLGEGSYPNYGMTVIDDYRGGECLVEIGERVSIGPGVLFIADSAPGNSPHLKAISYVRHRLIRRARISVEDDVWLGAGCIILPGVRIGAGAIVGAGAVVRNNVKRGTVVAGAPARLLRTLATSGATSRARSRKARNR